MSICAPHTFVFQLRNIHRAVRPWRVLINYRPPTRQLWRTNSFISCTVQVRHTVTNLVRIVSRHHSIFLSTRVRPPGGNIELDLGKTSGNLWVQREIMLWNKITKRSNKNICLFIAVRLFVKRDIYIRPRVSIFPQFSGVQATRLGVRWRDNPYSSSSKMREIW